MAWWFAIVGVSHLRGHPYVALAWHESARNPKTASPSPRITRAATVCHPYNFRRLQVGLTYDQIPGMIVPQAGHSPAGVTFICRTR